MSDAGIQCFTQESKDKEESYPLFKDVSKDLQTCILKIIVTESETAVSTERV